MFWLVYSGSHRLLSFPLEEATAANRQPIPPLRVGDFIRTFPFNTVTLKASQHELDVKIVIQELHKLTAELASGLSDKTKSRREEKQVKEDMDDEENFDSLFWGPKDPPLHSQCFKTT